MIDLKKFCNKRHKDLERPWSHGDYSYASNGYILIVVPRRDDITDPVPDCVKLSEFSELKIGDMPERTLPFPEFNQPKMIKCRVCYGHKITAICPECNGYELWVKNDFNSYEVDCKSCRGYGVIPSETGEECENCGGDGVVTADAWGTSIDGVNIGDVTIAKTLLAKVKDLPGICIGKPFPGDTYLRIFFDGGVGAIMGLAW